MKSISTAGWLYDVNYNFGLLFHLTPMSHIVTTAQASANASAIATGLTTITGFMVQIFRAGVNVTSDAIITATDGTLTVADGGTTYNTTKDDVINLLVWGTI